MRWDFIIKVLEAAGFPTRFKKWIAELITSPTYTININGSHESYFNSRAQEDSVRETRFLHIFLS